MPSSFPAAEPLVTATSRGWELSAEKFPPFLGYSRGVGIQVITRSRPRRNRSLLDELDRTRFVSSMSQSGADVGGGT